MKSHVPSAPPRRGPPAGGRLPPSRPQPSSSGAALNSSAVEPDTTQQTFTVSRESPLPTFPLLPAPAMYPQERVNQRLSEPDARGAARDSQTSSLQAASARANEAFRCFAHGISVRAGSPVAFALALGTILVWSLAGPVFGFSDTWQLVINTSTTIITFLMVFLVQATQNRDSEAIHLKLDELLRAVSEARSSLIDVESLPEYKLQALRSEFRQISREKSRAAQPAADEGPGRTEQPDEDSRRVG